MSVRGRRGLDPAQFAVRVTYDGRRLQPPMPIAQLAEHVDALLPVREPANTKHQRSRPSWLYVETVGDHVTCRNRLAERNLLMLDYDPQVVDILPEPFVLLPNPRSAKGLTPDFLVRLTDGRRAIVDVVSEHRAGQQRTQRHLRLMAQACELVGYEHWALGEPNHVVCRNVRWLAGYRRALPHMRHLIHAVLEAAGDHDEPATVAGLAQAAGRRALGLPVVFHLLWHRLLRCDLTRFLDDDTPVWRATVPGPTANPNRIPVS